MAENGEKQESGEDGDEPNSGNSHSPTHTSNEHMAVPDDSYANTITIVTINVEVTLAETAEGEINDSDRFQESIEETNPLSSGQIVLPGSE